MNLHGYLALSDAFKCVFLETIELLNTACWSKLTSPLSENYAIFIPRLSHSFLSLCGAERAAILGYPLLAYTSLRNIFDNVVLTSAAVQKFTDFYAIEGIDPKQPIDPKKILRVRKNTEFGVREIMTGKRSGLSNVCIDELAKWDALFDYETHGARLSLISTKDWMTGKAPLPALPRYRKQEFALFVNRYCEVEWMVTRLLPLVQLPGIPLPAEWIEKWDVLDDSFYLTVNSLTEEGGKQIGAAIVEFVRTKFPFSGKSLFPL